MKGNENLTPVYGLVDLILPKSGVPLLFAMIFSISSVGGRLGNSTLYLELSTACQMHCLFSRSPINDKQAENFPRGIAGAPSHCFNRLALKCSTKSIREPLNAHFSGSSKFPPDFPEFAIISPRKDNISKVKNLSFLQPCFF
ncbi:hypothetical protein EGR_07410 [Echinococcus granulosus]|uniref:Uncharacterized protein n=1 Tax=Echinococcus granulosus TaxID=6210 RepID=W6U9R2_ECHGR|nr:hypothetical protein EGR_07410 [Echinococcus granulosus]EUB57750.1 hypothetical protein EGR_07410 [Echinococcus granulosus]